MHWRTLTLFYCAWNPDQRSCYVFQHSMLSYFRKDVLNNRVLQLELHLTTLCRWHKLFALIVPYTGYVKTTIPWARTAFKICNSCRGQRSRLFPCFYIQCNNSCTLTLQSKYSVGFNVTHTIAFWRAYIHASSLCHAYLKNCMFVHVSVCVCIWLTLTLHQIHCCFIVSHQLKKSSHKHDYLQVGKKL